MRAMRADGIPLGEQPLDLLRAEPALAQRRSRRSARSCVQRLGVLAVVADQPLGRAVIRELMLQFGQTATSPQSPHCTNAE